MACGPCQARNKNRPTFEVFGKDAKGKEKVFFTSPSKATAEAVSKRYPNSEVRATGKDAAPAPVAENTSSNEAGSSA
ncbi:hypothetical protein ACFY0G_32365 [Streptomyces sp. NPDC001552]|uniref:hypothetical protein n=1 Tax=Streptomyces sp. NPDC001552 TaxID=3364587 RepID=UPI00369823EB